MEIPSWFDPRAGAVGGLVMGSLAALINSSHGVLPAAIAGGKQAAYTFFFGGLIVQLCTCLASRPGPRGPVLAVAVTLPFLVTVVFISVVHGLRGTPEPLFTIGAVVLVGLPSLVMWAKATRKQIDGLALSRDT